MRQRLQQPREIFGPFRVYERLGVGGTASVFRAELACEGGDHVEVSLKRLHPHLAGNQRVIEEFLDEARIARLMEHRNICRFFQIGRLGHDYFIATEYIEGSDLGRLMQIAHERGRPPSLSVVLSVLVQLCDALGYAHERVDEQTGERLDFVHRDVSPSNLIVTPDGVLKLIDMGIAKARVSAIRTETGIIKGKLSYMAPEVIGGAIADRRADIFSAGVVAWEMLCAERLFAGGSDHEIIERIQGGLVPPPSTGNPACPPQIDSIVLRALAPRPRDRWPTAGAMKRALEAVAVTMHEPVSEEVVAQWVRSCAQPVTDGDDEAVEISFTPTATGVGASTVTPTNDEPTGVRSRQEKTLPRRPGRFPTGTGQLPLAAPDESGEQVAVVAGRRSGTADGFAGAVVMGPEAQETTRGRSPWLAAVLGVSLVANLVLGIGMFVAGERGAETAGIAVPAPKPVAGSVPETVPVPETVAVPDAMPETVAVPEDRVSDGAEGKLEIVDAEELERRYGRWPRSRASRAPWRARVCVGVDGKVTDVQVLEGPERLHRRIARTVKHWRYRPYERDGEVVAVCTEVADRLRAWKRR